MAAALFGAGVVDRETPQRNEQRDQPKIFFSTRIKTHFWNYSGPNWVKTAVAAAPFNLKRTHHGDGRRNWRPFCAHSKPHKTNSFSMQISFSLSRSMRVWFTKPQLNFVSKNQIYQIAFFEKKIALK